MDYYYRPPPVEESIYSLIPPERVAQKKEPRHVSRYPHDTPPTASTFGPSATSQILGTNLAGTYEPAIINHRHVKAGATMGPKNEHYADPTSFLTKQNKPPLPNPTGYRYSKERQNSKKLGPPRASETLPTIAKPRKNYIQQNALAAITQVPGNRPQEAKRFTEKTDYGRVPRYLGKVKAEMHAERDYVRAAMDQERAHYESGQPKMRLLAEEERATLLENLKRKWEVVNKLYQGQTHCVVLDTIGKVRRKEDYEGQLQQLEKSVEKLSKKFVFVEDHGY